MYELKQYKYSRGFTLIELLAVIVVLAIVMLIGVNQVLPRMESARRQAFAIEANALKESAQFYYLTENVAAGVSAVDGLCMTVSDLVQYGYSSLDKNKYSGKVVMTLKDTGKGIIQNYSVYLSNGQFMVVGKGVDADQNNVAIVDADIQAADGFKGVHDVCS